MVIVAVDDEKMALEVLISAISKSVKDAEIHSYRSVNEAYEFIKSSEPDVVFLDIEMKEVNGIEFAKKIKLIKPTINIVFATGYSEFLRDAFELHASGYLLKPITADKVAKELENLRFPVETKKSSKKMRVQCFGNFEVYIDNVPVKFKYTKTKEVLAYLVNRAGALSSNNEIIVALWEDDDNHDSYFKNIKKDLLDTLEQHGLLEIIEKRRSFLGINTELIDCDYYDMKKGIPYALNAYRGEYMAQYSWAEFTMGILE